MGFIVEEVNSWDCYRRVQGQDFADDVRSFDLELLVGDMVSEFRSLAQASLSGGSPYLSCKIKGKVWRARDVRLSMLDDYG